MSIPSVSQESSKERVSQAAGNMALRDQRHNGPSPLLGDFELYLSTALTNLGQ